MILWVTEIIAEDPLDKKVKRWVGPNVPGISQDDAQKFCNENGLGFCKVIGKLVKQEPQEKSYFHVQYQN